MSISGLGYDKDLFILPFDHRRSFEQGLLGISRRQADANETEQLAAYKRVIYDGFLQATEQGAPQSVPIDTAAILVDQKYGEEILSEANRRGITTCTSVEKSGQPEFDFEYGEGFAERLHDASSTFAKVLVRYNPGGDSRSNENQKQKLKLFSSHAHSAGYKFMFDLLIPPTEVQLELVGKQAGTYELEVRPRLVVRAIEELQNAEIEPDVWKLEGIEDQEAARSVVAQARSGARAKVGVIISARGEDEGRIRAWLTVGAQTPGVIGFGVGRTVFWQPLVGLRDGALTRAQAVTRIAESYQSLYQLFMEARSSDPG